MSRAVKWHVADWTTEESLLDSHQVQETFTFSKASTLYLDSPNLPFQWAVRQQDAKPKLI